MKPINQNGLRVLYLIMLMEGLSLLGTRMTSMSIGIWLYYSTHQTTPILWIALFNELPAMLAGSMAGIVIDRFPKRLVLLLSDAGQAVGSVLLVMSFLFGFFSLPLLLAIVFLQGTCSMFQSPALQTVTAMLTSEEQRDRVNGIRETIFPLAGIIAPACISILYEPLGITGIVIVDGMTFLASAIFLLSVRLPDEARKNERNIAQDEQEAPRDIFAGIRFMLRYRLITLVVYIGVVNFLLNGTLEMAVAYVSGSSKKVGWEISFVLLCMNAGAFAGALIVAWVGRFRDRIKVMSAGYLVTGIMFIVFATVKGPIWLGFSLMLLMLPLPVGNAMISSYFQSKAPTAIQGRVFAFLYQTNMTSSSLSFLSLGPLVDHVLQPAAAKGELPWLYSFAGDPAVSGIALLYSAAGIIIMAVALTAFFRSRKLG
ncbi:MFS transporter [Paenibacillus silvisoli]|uniref:MFS transporter n=1 Tax=Paenibacillus silvisoli TaxID=3110539 RepID=UPI002805398B|nr:MFS transporter [Paenibacillus silvisoli]